MTGFSISPTHQPLRRRIRVPADKSVSHRAAILGALAEGDMRVENFLPSETTRATLNTLRSLGAEIEQPEPDTLLIRGRGLRSLREPTDILFLPGSGTTMRLMAASAPARISFLFSTARPHSSGGRWRASPSLCMRWAQPFWTGDGRFAAACNSR